MPGGGRQGGPERGIIEELKDTSGVGAGPVHSLELAMAMLKPTRLYVLNMYSLAYVNYASVTLLLDRDENVPGAPQAV